MAKDNKLDVMNEVIDLAKSTSSRGVGGPFGAAIVKDGEVICVTSNTVLRDNDPTAHAEMNAIREACYKLGTYDLSGCKLYCSGYPCPMCLSAIIWANIKEVYYCNNIEAADDIGFRDDFIRKFIAGGCEDTNILNLQQLYVEDGQKLYDDYLKNNKQMY